MFQIVVRYRQNVTRLMDVETCEEAIKAVAAFAFTHDCEVKANITRKDEAYPLIRKITAQKQMIDCIGTWDADAEQYRMVRDSRVRLIDHFDETEIWYRVTVEAVPTMIKSTRTDEENERIDAMIAAALL